MRNLPRGLAGLIAGQQQVQQSDTADLQQAQMAMGLRAKLQDQAREQQFQAALQQSGGDPEKAMQIALASGNIEAAQRLAPVIEARRRAAAPAQDTRPEILRLQEALGKYPEGHPLREQINARISALGPKPVPEPKAPPQTNLGRLMAERDSLPPNDPRRRAYDAAIRKDSETPAQIAPPKDPKADLQTPENAGKIAMGRQAIEGISTARGILFDKEGNLNRGLIGAMNLPIVSGLPMNSQARIARSAMRNAVEAKLRIETGAAATESEVDRTLARFMPTVSDTKESAKFKLDELDKFFKSSLSITKGAGGAQGAPAATTKPNVVNFGDLK